MPKQRLTFDDFINDLQDLHETCRNFHDKWHNISSDISVTPEQQNILRSIWDQHEAWYGEKIQQEENN